MSILRKYSLTTVFLLSLTVVAASANDAVDYGRRLFLDGKFEEAANMFSSAVEDNPRNFEALLGLGHSCAKLGQYDKARESFLESFFMELEDKDRVGEAFYFLLEENLPGAAKIRYGDGEGKSAVYSKAVSRIFDEGKNLAFQGKFNESALLFSVSTALDPDYGLKAYGFYLQLGDAEDGLRAESLYALALDFSGDGPRQRETIAYRFLKLAPLYWPGEQCDRLKEKASFIIGKEKVREIFPPPTFMETFKKTYTLEDAIGDHGQIETIRYGLDDVQPGDQIEVLAKLRNGRPFSGKPIRIWRSREGYSSWVKILDGRYSETVESAPEGFSFIINLANRKDVEATVTVKRMRERSPRLELLDDL